MSSDGRKFPGYFVGSGTALQHRSGVSAIPLCTPLARGVPLSRLRWDQGLGNAERALAVRRLSISGVGYRRHDFPRQPLAADHVVSSDVLHDESEKWCQRLGPATGVGFWELQDRLGSAPQAAASNGTARPGSAAGCDRSRRDLLGRRGTGRDRSIDPRKDSGIVAAEEDGRGIGRIRLRRIPDFNRRTLHSFIAESVEPGSTVRTDGLNAYRELQGYVHDRQVQRHAQGEHLLPRAHRVFSLLKRWLLGTHQGAIGYDHLDDYLNEFTFRFNRRKSASRGKLFYRLAQQAVQVEPVTLPSLTGTTID